MLLKDENESGKGPYYVIELNNQPLISEQPAQASIITTPCTSALLLIMVIDNSYLIQHTAFHIQVDTSYKLLGYN